MSKRRNKRIEEVLKEELSKIIHKEANLMPEVLITLTKIEVASDIKTAKVWISVFPEKDRAKAMQQLQKQLPYFQYLLVKKMNMKWVPSIRLVDDISEEEAEKIEVLIQNQ